MKLNPRALKEISMTNHYHRNRLILMIFESVNQYDMPWLAPYLNVLFLGPCDFAIRYSKEIQHDILHEQTLTNKAARTI